MRAENLSSSRKGGRAFAVMISPEDFERYRSLQKERFFQAVDEIQQRHRYKDPDEVLADVTAAVGAVRQEGDEEPMVETSTLSHYVRRG